MSHSGKLHRLPAREKPLWKLDPSQRIARGFCPHCLTHDPHSTHETFGCNGTAWGNR
jgi:hypothetical protein